MSEATPDRDEEMLARLAEFDLAAAERVHGRLMAAEEAGEIAELGRTYQRVARSLRQTLALKAKLKQDRERAAANAAAARAAPPSRVEAERRAREVRAAAVRVIWNEAEGEDAIVWLEQELDEVIAFEMLEPGFCAELLDDHVARLCAELDLSPEAAARWRDLPDPPEVPWEARGEDPGGGPAEDPDRRSSA